MSKNVITAIGSSKVWGYVAMGASALALVGVAILVKEKMDAKKAASMRVVVESDLEGIKDLALGSVEPVNEMPEMSIEPVENTSSCNGCSNLIGKHNASYIPKLTSRYNTSEFGGGKHERDRNLFNSFGTRFNN